MSFVEKNRDVSRLICTEPSLNMFYQLGLGKLLERRLFQVFGIDFEFQQAVNRDLARLGSRRKGKGLVTLDLSSASDSLSIGMMKEVFPPSVVSWLELFRSPVSRLPNGASMQLNMISTMGNGSTFPIQTVLFACVVSAAARCNHLDLVRRDPELDNFPNFGVFGDDIICETIISRDVVRLLTILGFEVHPEKSFFEGPFRESCGGDYFNGHPVRGVYLKTLKEPHNAYPVINRLNLWTAVHGIRVPRTVGRLIKHTKNPYWVPVWENEDAGIRCTESNLRKKRYARKTNSLIYKRWVPRARRLTIKDGYVHVPKGEKSRSYNASGLLVAFLRGDIDGGYITVRQRQVVYSSKTGVTSNWDYAPSKYGVALNWNITPTGSALPADIRLPNFGWAVAVNTAKP